MSGPRGASAVVWDFGGGGVGECRCRTLRLCDVEVGRAVTSATAAWAACVFEPARPARVSTALAALPAPLSASLTYVDFEGWAVLGQGERARHDTPSGVPVCSGALVAGSRLCLRHQCISTAQHE